MIFSTKVEDWKFVAFPDPDWALVIWCGHNPVLQYNGKFFAFLNVFGKSKKKNVFLFFQVPLLSLESKIWTI